MTRNVPAFCAVCILVVAASADDLLDSYEGDALPAAPEFSFVPCDNECVPALENGYFVLRWLGGSEIVNYLKPISNMFADPPPPDSFWIEWRFRSDQTMSSTNGNLFCDGSFTIAYKYIHDVVHMLGDAVVSNGETSFRAFPDRAFRTYRFESTGGLDYRIFIDGLLFHEEVSALANYNGVYFQMIGLGSCNRNFQTEAQENAWDFVRWGEIGYGEQVASADPPAGVVNAAAHPGLDRFTVTFDSPNYVLVDEISVSTTLGEAPVVTATRRLDNGPSDTVEILLDRPLPLGATTTFSFDDGHATNVVAYTYAMLQSCCFSSGQCDELAAGDCAAQGGTAGVSASCEGDADGDGIDGVCGDGCPADAAKLAPGQCGCSVADVDSDADTVADCNDRCEGDDDRIDTNGDNIPDCDQFIGIPTTTAWGLCVLSLLLLIAAKARRIPE